LTKPFRETPSELNIWPQTPPGGFTMKRHIPFQQDLIVTLFAVMFVVMLLVFLASVPLVNYLFPGN